MPDFFPRADAELLSFTANFAQKLSADYERFHVDPVKAAELLALQEEFAICYQTAVEPGSRTVVSVQRKNDLRARLKKAIRSFASPLKANSAVSDSDLTLLGLHRPLKPRRFFAAPSDAPKVFLKSIGGRRIRVMLRDAHRPTSRARPKDISGAVIFMRVGDKQADNPNSSGYETLTRQMDFDLEVKELAAPGTQVWVWAMWMNRRGTGGPRSEPVCVRLSFDELIVSQAA